MIRDRYGAALRATIAASAGPYGYTLTIWTSGAVLAHARGIPSSVDALLFLFGAVVAYALVGALAISRFRGHVLPEPSHAVVWGGLHIFSVGAAIGAATLVAHVSQTAAAWPVGGFVSTALYLLGSALQLVLATAPGGLKWSRRAGEEERKEPPGD